MFHLDNNSGVSAMPPVGAVQSSAPRWYTEGGGGTPASYPGADWYNIIQAELLNLLSAYGINPNKSDFNQLQHAIEEAISQNATANSALLTAIAALVTSANKMPYFTGTDKVAMTDLTAFARTLLGRSDAAGVLSDLGLQFFKSSPSSVSSAFTSVFSPDENIRIVLANNRVWGVQDNDGNVIPLPLDRGGLGATSAEEGVKNLGLADSEGRVGRLINVRVITASGTYTPSAGTKSVVAEIQGGGGAGGGSLGSVPTQASAGTGGNAGAYILHRFTTPPSGITVTIGAGGMGVPGANGNPGGNTSFGSMTAPGGAGGIYYAPQTPPLFSFNNSSSVTPTGGNLVNKAGQRGDPATVTSPLYGGSGDGGASLLGGGGDGRGVVAVSSNGNTATGYGAGGGGATSGGGSGGNASGGNGAPGVVIVWEYA
ncbi:TPA: hypothetical protein ACU9LL_002032 [Citrobacter freundii]